MQTYTQCTPNALFLETIECNALNTSWLRLIKLIIPLHTSPKCEIDQWFIPCSGLVNDGMIKRTRMSGKIQGRVDARGCTTIETPSLNTIFRVTGGLLEIAL